MAHFLYYIQLCASFQSHRWFQTVVTVNSCINRRSLSRVTLIFDEWPLKLIGRLFYTTSSFVHHFIAMCQFKLELQSGNSGQNRYFLPCVILKFDGWPWKNIRAPLLCYFKLYAPFHSHQWNQTGVTIRKRPIRVKIDDFMSRVTLKCDRLHRKNNKAHLLCYFKLCTSFRCHRWI